MKKQLITLGIIMILAGCGASSTTSTGQEADGPSYPALYTQEGLPEYTNAELVSIGRQQESLKDGIRLELTSTDSIEQILDFYETSLAGLGWDVPESRMNNDSAYLNRYTKESLIYQITISNRVDYRHIGISYSQN